MKINKDNWLSHLNYLPKDITGYKTCTYLMALEGWRRGLTLKFHINPGVAIPPSIRFSLSNGKREHLFSVSRGDKVTNEARKICMEKPMTYKYLAQNNIPIPEGKSFTEQTSDEEINEYAKIIDFPLVIKPTDGGSGKGVITNINDLEDFNNSLIYVRHNLGYKNVIVERFIKGEDYRIYIVKDKVVGVYKRISANVIGDGKSTIRQLIKEKNNLRKKNPFIQNRSIVINEDLIKFISKSKLGLNSIPDKGERVFLREQGAYLKERDPVDITEKVPEEIKEIAVNGMKSIPGLTHCDVDMLVNEQTGKGFINEINSRPQISNHLFPIEGKARDIPKEIIDYYFPETKDGERSDLFYYDFKPVFEGFKAISIEEFVIPDIPLNHVLTRFRLEGDFQKVNFERLIKRQAIKLELNGYLKHLNNGETSIVVSGNTSALDKFREFINSQSLTVKKVREFERDAPIQIGFEIKKQPTIEELIIHNKDLIENEKVLKKEIVALKNKVKIKEKKYNEVIQSTSWRSTKFLRKIGKTLKK